MKLKKFITSWIIPISMALTSCNPGTTVLSEQYFEQPIIKDNVMTVELLHKEESKWLDVIKGNATSIGLTAVEFSDSEKSTTSKNKNDVDVYLKKSDVFAEDGSYNPKTKDLVDKYELAYLDSDYYNIDGEDEDKVDIDTSKVTSDDIVFSSNSKKYSDSNTSSSDLPNEGSDSHEDPISSGSDFENTDNKDSSSDEESTVDEIFSN